MATNTKWNLSYLKDNDLEKVKEESYKFISKWSVREDYLQDPKVLKEVLDEYELWERNFGTGGDALYKLGLESILDQNNPKIKAKYNQLHKEAIKIANDIEFFTLRLAKIPEERQKLFLDAPNLNDYKHFLEGIFENAKHLLSEPEEKIMNLKNKVSHGNWVEMVENLLSKEEYEEKNFSVILNLLSDVEKPIRDSAAKGFNKILETHLDEAEHEINAILENDQVDNELRKFTRPDESRHLADDVDSSIVDALVTAVAQSFDISAKFYELKAKLLGQEKLEYHERNVPYGSIDKKINFEDAVEVVSKTFSNLDSSFSDTLNKYLEKGQIDAFPTKNKSSGAMCISNLKTQPIFVYLNYLEKISDVTALAHEMGHAIHFELAREKQNSLNDGASLAIAEVASTFMENFVLEEMTKDLDDDTRLALQMEQLNDQISSIQRQIACYKFEQELHTNQGEKGYLSQEEIGKLFQKHMQSYMGDFVEQSKGAQNWWVYWSHIRNFFYVYSYASGLLISKNLQQRTKENPKFIEDFKELLSKGSSESPKNAFLSVGIDISKKEFWEAGLAGQRKLLEDTWTLAQKLEKI
jgi:oligoendopeptidase F